MGVAHVCLFAFLHTSVFIRVSCCEHRKRKRLVHPAKVKGASLPCASTRYPDRPAIVVGNFYPHKQYGEEEGISQMVVQHCDRVFRKCWQRRKENVALQYLCKARWPSIPHALLSSVSKFAVALFESFTFVACSGGCAFRVYCRKKKEEARWEVTQVCEHTCSLEDAVHRRAYNWKTRSKEEHHGNLL